MSLCNWLDCQPLCCESWSLVSTACHLQPHRTAGEPGNPVQGSPTPRWRPGKPNPLPDQGGIRRGIPPPPPSPPDPADPDALRAYVQSEAHQSSLPLCTHTQCTCIVAAPCSLLQLARSVLSFFDKHFAQDDAGSPETAPSGHQSGRALGSSHDAPGGNAPSRGGVSSTLGPGATKHPSAGKAPSSTRPNLVSTTPALPNAVLCQMSVEMDFATNQQHAWSPQHRWPLLPNLISGATCLLGPRCMHAIVYFHRRFVAGTCTQQLQRKVRLMVAGTEGAACGSQTCCGLRRPKGSTGWHQGAHLAGRKLCDSTVVVVRSSRNGSFHA